MKALVAIMDAPRYDVGLIAAKIISGLEAIGCALPRSAKVLIKPNVLAQNYPSQCTTTHPAVIDALCGLLADNDCTLTIGESSAFWQPGHTRRAFTTSGIADVAKKHGAALVAFEEDGGSLRRHEGNAVLKEVLLTRRLDENDFLINVPKLKTHSFFRLSGAVKNLFGLVPGGAKYEYHFVGGFTRDDFGEKLADIAALARPYLSIVDAITGLEGLGPAATGKPRHTGLLLLGQNPFALDCACARIIGLDPIEVRSTVAAIRRELLPLDASFEAVGDHADLPYVPYRIPPCHEEVRRADDALYRIVAARPVVRPSRCIACGVCADACPCGAITMHGSPEHKTAAMIDRSLCLNCYLCHYLCPERAIALRGVWYAQALYLLRRVFRI
mgnify:FL=1